MAFLKRQNYTKPIPKAAELVTIKGVPSARFRDKSGKIVTAPLAEDGQRIRRSSRKWYAFFTEAEGGGPPIPLYTDKEASKQRLAELVRKREHGKAGLVDPFELHRARTLADHLDDYRRYLGAEGNCTEHVAKTSARIKAIIDGCGFQRIADLASEKVAEFMHGLRRDPPRPVLAVGQETFTPAELADALGGTRPGKLSRIIAREKLPGGTGNGKARRYPRPTVERLQEIFCRGIGIATSNGYMTAIKGFSRWLLEKERTDRDRLVSLSRLNANTDIRHARRALDEADLNHLLSSAWASASTFEGLAGKDRAMLYMLAMTTGLRASELASVTPSSFAFEANGATVTVRAAYTKNQNEAEQPLPPDVAEAFRAYLIDRPALSALWPGKWNDMAAEMLRVDLDGAGIAYRDAAGDVADFHALRHSYVSLLGRMGASPKVTQTLARHSDIRLTMNVYSHAQMHDLSAAVDNLPINPPGGKSPTADRLQMTGTDATFPMPSRLTPGLTLDFDSRRGLVRTDDDQTEQKSKSEQSGTAMVLRTCEDEGVSEKTDDENYPAWIRTRTKRAKMR